MTSEVHRAIDRVHENVSSMNSAYVRSVASVEEALCAVRAALCAVPEVPSPARDGHAAIQFAVNLGDGAMEFLYDWLEGDTSEWPEFASYAASPDIAPIGTDHDTPPSDWIAQGKSDPHGDRYDCPRSALIGGDMTDDEVANAIYLDGSEKNLTIAKDRIRWLSRQLIAARSPT
jgi:hypothetical protein